MGLKSEEGPRLIRGLGGGNVCAFTASACVCEFASRAHPAGFNPY